eukprot:1196044-Prorocentrum_minimum.AAC.14
MQIIYRLKARVVDSVSAISEARSLVIRPMRSRKCGSLPHAVPERSQSVVSRHLVPRVLQLTVTGAYSL